MNLRYFKGFMMHTQLQSTYDFLLAEYQKPSLSSQEVSERFFGLKLSTLKQHLSKRPIDHELHEQILSGSVSLAAVAEYLERARQTSSSSKV